MVGAAGCEAIAWFRAGLEWMARFWACGLLSGAGGLYQGLALVGMHVG